MNETPDDKTLDFLEQQIPYLASAAFELAFCQALAAGLSVHISKNNALYELFPDGTEVFVKNLEPRIHIPIGTKAFRK